MHSKQKRGIAFIMFLILIAPPIFVSIAHDAWTNTYIGKPGDFPQIHYVFAPFIFLIQLAFFIVTSLMFWNIAYQGSKKVNDLLPQELNDIRLLCFYTYMLFLSIFATIYLLINFCDPDSFTCAGDAKAMNSPLNALYFSVITSATIGYGDITPKSDFAKAIVCIQTVLSFFYTIAIVSKIVNLERLDTK